jgi:chemotaxis response regulator CheB
MDQSPSKKKRKDILIADDHKVVVQGVVSTLNKHPEFQVIGKAFDGMEAIEMAKSFKPDILIMDTSMPNIDGVAAGGTYYSEFANKIIHGHMQDLELGKAKTAKEPENGFARLTRREE